MKKSVMILLLFIFMVTLFSPNASQVDQDVIKEELRKGNFEKAKSMMLSKGYGAESAAQTVIQLITEYFQLELQQMAGHGSDTKDYKSKAVELAQEFRIDTEALKMPVFIGYAAAINNLNSDQLAEVKDYLKEQSLAPAIIYYGHLQLSHYLNSEDDLLVLMQKFELLGLDLQSETVQNLMRDYLGHYLTRFVLAHISLRQESIPGRTEANKIKWLLKHFPKAEVLLLNRLRPEFKDDYIDLLAKAKKNSW